MYQENPVTSNRINEKEHRGDSRIAPIKKIRRQNDGFVKSSPATGGTTRAKTKE
jgi:hypothetical protein